MTAAALDQTDGTKKRLREAMESLVAERGFDGVSVRDITGLAKANVAAVNYHFGSREGMIQHVIESQLRPVMEERRQILSLHAPTTVPEWLHLWYEPLRELFTHANQSDFQALRIMGRCLEMSCALPLLTISKDMLAQEQEILEKIAVTTPAMPSSLIMGKMHFCEGALIHIMVHGHLRHTTISILQQWDLWLNAISDLFSEHAASPKKTKALRTKIASKAPKVAIIEQEIAKAPLESPACVDTPSEIAPASHPEDDGYGGMFLF